MDCEDRELLETFIEEAKEYLEVLNSGLLSLETSGSDKNLIHSIFRAAHSLKGNAALIGFDDIKTLSHALESVFDAIREGTAAYSEKMYDTLFSTVDTLSNMIEQVITGASVTKDYSGLIARLNKFIEPGFAEENDPEEESESEVSDDSSDETDEFDTETILAFCDDTRDVISSVFEDLLSLEETPEDRDLADSISNRLRSLTGGASFLSLDKVCEVSSSLENLIASFKKSPGQFSKKHLGFLGYMFEGVDLLGHTLGSSVKENGITPESRLFLSEIKEFSKGQEREDTLEEIPDSGGREPRLQDITARGPVYGKTAQRPHESIRVSSRKLDETIKLMGEMVSNFSISRQRFALLKGAEKLSRKNLKYLTSILSESKPHGQALFSATKGLMGIIAIEEKLLEPAQVVNILHTQKTTGLRFGDAAVSMGYLAEDDINRLISLQEFHKPVHLAFAELKEIKKNLRDIVRIAEVLDQSVRKIVKSEKEEQLTQEVLTNDLKENALKMRMLPLSVLFNTFARFVRDTGRMVSKSVVLEISGGDTELDRKMIEKLGDPLIHMIRNAIDHGIEPADIRKELKKNASGRIKVSGRYEGGSVLVEISDDGRGIDLRAIAEKAVKKGIYQAEDTDKLSDEQIMNVIFHPGFSTADAVTEISGRGVGLDVVKKNIVEDLKGAVEIKSVCGEGTTFNIRLPITLALIKVMNIDIAKHQFAIPMTYIREIINIPQSDLISVLDKTTLLLHDVIVPVINLGDLLGIKNTTDSRESFLVLLVRLGNETVGFKVDEVRGEESTVIKPLPPHMKNLQLVSGVKISADNEIVNILHIPNILKQALTSGTGKLLSAEPARNIDERMHKILLIDDSEMALKHGRKILENEGYNVDTVNNAFEGLDMIKEFKYDLVITDIEMPGKDGFTFTHELRRFKEYKRVPVIVSSSLEKEKFRQRAKEVGADGYIVKKNFSAATVSNILKALPEHL